MLWTFIHFHRHLLCIVFMCNDVMITLKRLNLIAVTVIFNFNDFLNVRMSMKTVRLSSWKLFYKLPSFFQLIILKDCMMGQWSVDLRVGSRKLDYFMVEWGILSHKLLIWIKVTLDFNIKSQFYCAYSNLIVFIPVYLLKIKSAPSTHGNSKKPKNISTHSSNIYFYSP